MTTWEAEDTIPLLFFEKNTVGEAPPVILF
jgi:hypothetical protein